MIQKISFISLFSVLVAACHQPTQVVLKPTSITDSFERETKTIAKKDLLNLKSEIDRMVLAIQNNELTAQTKQKILTKLIAKNPEYLHRLSIENISTPMGNDVLKLYYQKIQADANVKAAKEILDRENAK